MKNEAQEAWKLWYWKWKHAKRLSRVTRESRRIELYRYRREAALERKLEVAQRKIEQLQDRVWKLEAQEHNRDDGNEWEKEYYLRGMHR